jgi:hypothetical protein
MGRVWSVDAVAKNASTSFYGNIVSLAESPLKEGVLYVGTDDGLVQVSEDGGKSWRRIERFPGVPEMTYVSRLLASQHAAGTVYAAFDNHKMGDFKPYVLKSTDYGRSWTPVAGDLPARGSIYALAEDHVDPDLLFAGTEFGVFFTADGGKRWVQLKGGMPVICVKDLAIQKRESDLVVATFGRGFYILDDYSPLRRAGPDVLAKDATLFPVKPAQMYIPARPLGLREKSAQGDAFFTAPNPPFGAIFTYYLKDPIRSRKDQREEAEKEILKKGGDVYYPSWDSLRAEDREEEPTVLLTVTDEEGNIVRRLAGPVTAGFHRVAWDLRYPSSTPTRLKPSGEENPFVNPDMGPLVAPGTYRVGLAERVDGKVRPLGAPQSFTATPLGNASLPARDREALLAFQEATARLQRAVMGAAGALRESRSRIEFLKKALDDTPGADPRLAGEARALDARLADLDVALNGDETVARRNEPTPPSILDRVQTVVNGQWVTSTSDATRTHRRGYEIAAAEFAEWLPKLRALLTEDLPQLERRAEAAGAPWTPGRVPEWRPE